MNIIIKFILFLLPIPFCSIRIWGGRIKAKRRKGSCRNRKKKKKGCKTVKNTSTQNTALFYAFLIQRPLRFTPLLKLRFLTFGLTPFWLVSSHLCKSIISYGNIVFDLRHFDLGPFFFQECNYGVKKV